RRAGTRMQKAAQPQVARHASADSADNQGTGGDKAPRGSLVLPPDQREQRDGSADTGERHDHLQDGANDDAGIRAMPEDVVRSAQRIVEKEGRDRDEAEQVERACSKRCLSKWTHWKLLVDKVIDATTTD